MLVIWSAVALMLRNVPHGHWTFLVKLPGIWTRTVASFYWVVLVVDHSRRAWVALAHTTCRLPRVEYSPGSSSRPSQLLNQLSLAFYKADKPQYKLQLFSEFNQTNTDCDFDIYKLHKHCNSSIKTTRFWDWFAVKTTMQVNWDWFAVKAGILRLVKSE